MKYNFKMLIGKKVGFSFSYNGMPRYVSGILQRVKQTKTDCIFTFTDRIFTINEIVFMTMLIQLVGDEVRFTEGDRTTISGLCGFTMFDTYGFPIELTKEILEESGLSLDVNGFEVLRQLQKMQSKGTFAGGQCF